MAVISDVLPAASCADVRNHGLPNGEMLGDFACAEPIGAHCSNLQNVVFSDLRPSVFGANPKGRRRFGPAGPRLRMIFLDWRKHAAPLNCGGNSSSVDLESSHELGIGHAKSKKRMNDVAFDLAKDHRTPFLGDAVLRVISGGPKKQMVRVGAFGVVALVANMKAFWDFPKMNKPRRAAGGDLGLFRVATFHDHPVPERMLAAGPFPTAIGFDHFCPKPGWQCIVHRKPLGDKEVVKLNSITEV